MTDLAEIITFREHYRLVQVGWRYPYGNFMHGMEWRVAHPEHTDHGKCVPLYVLEEVESHPSPSDAPTTDQSRPIGPHDPLSPSPLSEG